MVYLLIDLVRVVATIFTVLVFARVILSWVNPPMHNPLVRFVVRTTEPLLGPIRGLLPAMGGLDFSPVLLLIAIQLAERLIVRALIGLSGMG